jgi:hypothetical protein
MADNRYLYTSKQYYAKHQGDEDNIPEDFKGLGYYRRTNLEDVINNFIVAYIGEDKALAKVPRYEVDFWAQRTVQEFSYDILHSEKSMEIELSDALTFPLPQDYVAYTAISQVEKNGEKTRLLPNRKVNNPTAPLQDNDYEFTFDSDDNLQEASLSESITKFQDDNNYEVAQEEQYYRYNDEEYPYFNKRYGSNPEKMNSVGTFVIDDVNGLIYFDGSLKRDKIIVLDYISDGLVDNGDLTKVYIPKLAEDALYASMLYNLAKVRPSLAGIVPLYKKEASAKMRNAKIRLSNYNLPELAQVLRGKAKWIKH